MQDDHVDELFLSFRHITPVFRQPVTTICAPLVTSDLNALSDQFHAATSLIDVTANQMSLEAGRSNLIDDLTVHTDFVIREFAILFLNGRLPLDSALCREPQPIRSSESGVVLSAKSP